MNEFKKLETRILGFAKCGAQVFSIGKSVLGRNIYCVAVGGHYRPKVIVQYAIHAREYITAFLALAHIEHALEICQNLKGCIYFVPAANPDGAALSMEGISSVKNPAIANFLLSINGGSTDFKLWKANARAVDLNVNFDAKWGTGVTNVRYPAPENFMGPYPNSEPETCALVNLTKIIKPKATISYHSKGEEIYYTFGQTGEQLACDEVFAKEISFLTGYPLVDTPGSAGGYKDWCIERLGIKALTIEVGSDSLTHPIDATHLPTILEQNLLVPQRTLELVNRCE